uniref:probable serine/threonine-protein kinase fhkB n=1 Tax=Ciona intestinalis TaxID=7719 RepID=UPI000EF4C818
MYIKSVTVDGFKSYAQQTDIKGFDPLFNAITGLNGSGKSNILDAICFLLGITNLSQPKVVGGSDEALPSSNDDTSHPSISEPQATVSSQDVYIPAAKLTKGQKRISAPGTSRDVKIARLSPTLSSQDVSIPAPKLTKSQQRRKQQQHRKNNQPYGVTRNRAIGPKVVGGSDEALPSSNDDTSRPSISEPQATVSSQDVSIPVPKLTKSQQRRNRRRKQQQQKKQQQQQQQQQQPQQQNSRQWKNLKNNKSQQRRKRRRKHQQHEKQQQPQELNVPAPNPPQ